ncbi:unnamed protein product [Amoebophrya sp. A25]|nr:unnamed protein product [Amoebophrya sp. A25]|eukprot:GSA25T00005774001.1
MAEVEESGVVAGQEPAASSSAPATPVKEPPSLLSFPFVPHTEMPEMKTAKKMTYCPECGLPPDFVEYGGKWEQSKLWVLANFPQYYPELAGLSLDDMKEEAAKKKAENAEKEKTKELPGGKKKRSASPKVVIKVAKRQGRKMITTVTGLDGFDVKLDAAAKLFKKKFACGSAAVKGGPGAPDSVEIQGDPGQDEIIALLKKEFPEVPSKKVEFIHA